jgi:hypothetical protein
VYVNACNTNRTEFVLFLKCEMENKYYLKLANKMCLVRAFWRVGR